MTTKNTATTATAKSTFKHPYIAGRETVLTEQVFSVELMQNIVDNYHPMNRPRQTGRQQALERDIRNGDYRTDVGNMIKFDRNGNMIDGQKRFYSHLNAGVPLQITVQYGLPLDAILFIDRNQPRTVAANVTLAKNINLNRQPTKSEFTADRRDISIATWCLHGLRWNEAGSASDKPIWTERELMEFVAQNERFIRFVLIEGATTRRPGALGAMAIYAMKNLQEASKFRNALYGFNDNHVFAGSPIHTLREYLKVKSDGGSAPIWDYFNTVRCINAFHAGQNIAGTSLNNGREDFSF
jgi:hypothetical protein